MDGHRRVASSVINFFRFEPPFSCFEYVEHEFQGNHAVRRIFSLARSFNAKTMVVEDIPPLGIIQEEIEDQTAISKTYENIKVIRISFWSQELSDEKDIDQVEDGDLIGYAIIKGDRNLRGTGIYWHVFEAVIRQYQHEHNCIPYSQQYTVTVGNNTQLRIKGCLYCQQNGLTNACAHVALRSVLSKLLPEADVSYRILNAIARKVHGADFNPAEGLTVPQIRAILGYYNVAFRDIDYSQDDADDKELMYQRFVYAGIESGAGALVGFSLSGSGIQEEAAHIIPLFGHTFNKDTWVPNADLMYFKIGEGLGYLPSEDWTSSFLGHDDNCGPNFCIPRLYINARNVKYAVEIMRPGTRYGGVHAEAITIKLLDSIMPHIPVNYNRWIDRLMQWTSDQRIVLRAQAITKDQYATHLREIRDWEGQEEDSAIIDFLKRELVDNLWMVEVSTPYLFPSNKRKVGEFILNAGKSLDLDAEGFETDQFMFARLPGIYLLGFFTDPDGQVTFNVIESSLKSHTELLHIS